MDASEEHLDQICPGVYLGCLRQARNRTLLSKHNVVAVVALGCPAAFPTDTSLSYLTYPRLLDVDSGSIMHTFEPSHEFISNALPRGNVLVHCVYGSSRSAAVVVAHVMMRDRTKTTGLGFDAAHELVRSRRPATSINLGFKRQLVLFEKMGLSLVGPVSVWHAEFRLFRFAQGLRRGKPISQCFENTSSPCIPAASGVGHAERVQAPATSPVSVSAASSTDVSGAMADGGELQASTTPPSDLGTAGRKQYHCRSCRALLYTDVNVLNHRNDDSVLTLVHAAWSGSRNVGRTDAMGTGTGTAIQSSLTTQTQGECACTSDFVEPLSWMGIVNTQCPQTNEHGVAVTSRLNCYRCGAKVGQMDLQDGLLCSCQRRVWPAFQIHASRVDVRVQRLFTPCDVVSDELNVTTAVQVQQQQH
jgi:hypothetical protein